MAKTAKSKHFGALETHAKWLKTISDTKRDIEYLKKIYPYHENVDAYVKKEDVLNIIDKHARALSNNVTNGDVITNNFPNAEIFVEPYQPVVTISICGIVMAKIDKNWWEAPFECEKEKA